ncbi:helix-turn-helix domain-containing protein [Blautia sp. MSJ-19]|uniref:helix-turn-helix domain-containing protein n=1 Tax=Blautia sp. MSJ-19 TaxID=2841517 RepID=UPI001C0F24E7|nr:AraC family transcriptional regulator [Blautia sp. MSJ-19]MBU5481457.1 AraC family transcriptional regulator [Blautia sp. MSJ-19]
MKSNRKNSMQTVTLAPGMELSYYTVYEDNLSLHHRPLSHVMEINYCHAGRIGWKMKNGTSVYLGPGDYSIHTMEVCADSKLSLPNKYYEGFTLCVDLDLLTKEPPALLKDTGITGELLLKKYCLKDCFSSFVGNEETNAIFEGFYGQPENLLSAYQNLKALELFLYLAKAEPAAEKHLDEYQTEQVALIRQIHELLLSNLNRRITIEELSKEYLINTTTLKNVFKAVYGTSIAAHVKEHRMEHAARMLLETDTSIADIANAVGYDSQSKFTSAFKDAYQVTPREYRKNH